MQFRYKICLVLLLLFSSCQTKNVSEQAINLSFLTARAPNTWKVIQLQGIDSDVQGIVTDSGDTLFLDYGLYSDSFDDLVVPVRSFERKKIYDAAKFHYPGRMIFSKTPEIDEAQAIHLSEYFLYDTINGKRAKIVLPKRIGKGITGIHFPEVNQKGTRLTIYGRNLDTLQQFAAYKLFQSIHFR